MMYRGSRSRRGSFSRAERSHRLCVPENAPQNRHGVSPLSGPRLRGGFRQESFFVGDTCVGAQAFRMRWRDPAPLARRGRGKLSFKDVAFQRPGVRSSRFEIPHDVFVVGKRSLIRRIPQSFPPQNPHNVLWSSPFSHKEHQEIT